MAKHPKNFAALEIDIEKLRQKQQVQKESFLKDLAQQDSILETIEETHTECSKLLQELKEKCSYLIKDGHKKTSGTQPQDEP